jgi:hypothetical protein
MQGSSLLSPKQHDITLLSPKQHSSSAQLAGLMAMTCKRQQQQQQQQQQQLGMPQ